MLQVHTEEFFDVTIVRDQPGGTLGIAVDLWDGEVTVGAITTDGPADREGTLIQGDIIRAVEGVVCGTIEEVRCNPICHPLAAPGPSTFFYIFLSFAPNPLCWPPADPNKLPPPRAPPFTSPSAPLLFPSLLFRPSQSSSFSSLSMQQSRAHCYSFPFSGRGLIFLRSLCLPLLAS